MKGMRQPKAKSTKQSIKELETIVQNMQMALQMSQMMVKHLTNQLQAVQSDVTNVMGMSNDFQYRTLAMLELGNFDKDELNTLADKFKLDDFTKASDKEDAVKGYEVDTNETITEDSIVIITSSTPDLAEDQGIFRSKFSMNECQTPALREALLGAKLGDTVEVELNTVKHAITILGLRVQKQVEVTEEDQNTEQE